MGRVEITRQGTGAHRAGHTWDLKVDGRYVGTYETKRQAKEAAERTAVDRDGNPIRKTSEVKIDGRGVTRSVRHIEADGTLTLGHVNAGNNRSRIRDVDPSTVVVTEF